MRFRRPIAAVLVAATVLGPASSLSAATPDKATCVAAYEVVQTARKAGKLREAHDKALVCAQAACPGAVRDDCAQWLGDIEKSLPTVVVVATDENDADLVDVEVWVDGEKIVDKLDGKGLPLDPGQHALKFVREGSPPVEQTIVVREGEKNRKLEVKLVPEKVVDPKKDGPKLGDKPPPPDVTEPPPDETPKPPPPPPVMDRPTPASVYVLGVAGLVGLGVFTTFSVMGMQNKTALDNRGCRPNCAQDDVDTIKRQFLIGDVGLALGVVSLGTAAVLYFTRGEEPRPTPKTGWTWQLAPSRTGAMGVVQLTF